MCIVGGDEHDQRRRLRLKLRSDLKTRQARHLNIQEDDVRRTRDDGVCGTQAVGKFTGNLYVALICEPATQLRARRFLIVDNDRAHHPDVSLNGREIDATTPVPTSLVMSTLAALPYSTRRRSRQLVIPMPSRQPSGSVEPVLWILMLSWPRSGVAATQIRSKLVVCSIPYLKAFSSSGCSSIAGTGTANASSAIYQSTLTRPEKRSCMISAYRRSRRSSS